MTNRVASSSNFGGTNTTYMNDGNFFDVLSVGCYKCPYCVSFVYLMPVNGTYEGIVQFQCNLGCFLVSYRFAALPGLETGYPVANTRVPGLSVRVLADDSVWLSI